ncbi:hypothetical protein GYMLUDRAFT_54573 [Collybiopsis luxurians FD-317 M1]|nr:hypothetical protein GYMLUDRAFT_54573 [Collybiopsis luxurians FD-317 M1]
MERTEDEPTYFPTIVFIGYIMTLLWLAASILTIVVFAVYPHMVQALNYHGLHSVTVGSQRFECVLCVVNLGLVGWFTARAHVIAMEEGNPDHWRILVERKDNPATTRQIRVQHPINLNDPSNIGEPRAAPPSPPRVPPDWVTAAVLEDNMEVARREPKSPYPQIEISSPPPSDDFDGDTYISDYYETQDEKEGGIYSEKGHFDGEDLYRQEHFDRVPSPHHSSHPSEIKEYSSDADSIYETDTPETPDRWSDEEEVEEEYPHTPVPGTLRH